MKNIVSSIAILMSLIFVSQSALADFQRVSCHDIFNSNQMLSLLIVNGELLQIRIQTNGSLPLPLMVTPLANQNIEGVTLFTISSSSILMKIDNSIFSGQYGQVELDHHIFSCMP